MTDGWLKFLLKQAIAALGISVIVTLIGPFDTFRALALPARFLYWSSLIGLGWLQWILLDLALKHAAIRAFGDWPGPWWRPWTASPTSWPSGRLPSLSARYGSPPARSFSSC